MRFKASPLVVAVALGLLHPSVLVDDARAQARGRSLRAAEPMASTALPVETEAEATAPGDPEPGDEG